jgi:hypothetical protein
VASDDADPATAIARAKQEADEDLTLYNDSNF